MAEASELPPDPFASFAGRAEVVQPDPARWRLPWVGVVLAAGRSQRLASVTGGGSTALLRLGGLKPGRAGGAVPVRRWTGAGRGGGRPRRRAGRDRRWPAWARPGPGRVCRPVGRWQRRVAGRGPGRGRG